MSTRSNTVIKDLKSGEQVFLYRHHDGYPSGAGFDQLGYLSKIEDESVCRKRKITVDLVKDWFIKNGDGYEETNSIHGDVAYVYFVEITGDEDVPLRLKAYNTKMSFENNGKGTTLNDDITDELLNEYVESEEYDPEEDGMVRIMRTCPSTDSTMKFGLEERGSLIKKILEDVIDKTVSGKLLMAKAVNCRVGRITSTIKKMDHLNTGIGFNYVLETFSPNSSTYDVFVELKDYLRNAFNYLFNGDIDVCVIEEHDRIDFEVVSRY
jgi:hypothetical protein